MVEYKITTSIDARGSFCPGPMMELIKAIRQADVGDFVEILSSDEGSLQDIPAWIAKAKHELIDTVTETDFNRFIVKKTW